MFKLPLDSLLTVAQPSPQLMEVQARAHHLTTLITHDQHAHTKSGSGNRGDTAAFLGPVVLKSLVMFRCCCQTGVLASYAYKQAMQAAQLLSCMMPWQRYFPALRSSSAYAFYYDESPVTCQTAV